MNINHEPLIDIKAVEEHYTKKDGEPVKYVCTTSLKNDTIPVDVFYRKTSHPEFGNRYFGLYFHPIANQWLICNADYIEELDFSMAKSTTDGRLHYSQHRHDYHSVDDVGAIDGGRSYTRCVGTVDLISLKIIDGEFKETVL